MLDAFPTRVAIAVEMVSTVPVEGTDNLLVTVRKVDGQHLGLQLTQLEAAQLMALIIAERHHAPSARELHER